MLKSIIQISGLYFASAIITTGFVMGWNNLMKRRPSGDQH